MDDQKSSPHWENLNGDEIRTILGSASDKTLRSWYEYAAHSMTSEGQCSEKTVVDTVIQMALDFDLDYKTLLDVGCGFNMHYDFALESHGKVITGIDFSQGYINLAQDKIDAVGSSIILKQANIKDLPFADESFDAAILSETLEHVSDDKTGLAEVKRILRKGGLLFFTVPNYWNFDRCIKVFTRMNLKKFKLMPGHLREYSKRKVRAILEPAFEIKKFYPVPIGYDPKSKGGFIDKLILKDSFGFSRFGMSIACVAVKP